MHDELPQPLRKIDLSDEERIIGGLKECSIEAPAMWGAAAQAQNKVLFRFHLLRAVRPDAPCEPMVVHSRREDIAYETVKLASRLMEAAVTVELPILMADIKDALSKPQNDL